MYRRDKSIEIIEPKGNIQEYNKSINIDKVNELVGMIDTLKEMIEHYNKNKNIIDVEVQELKPKAITEVKKWEKFVSNHKEFKVQQLISLALEEFIQKYN